LSRKGSANETATAIEIKVDLKAGLGKTDSVAGLGGGLPFMDEVIID
jgi:hypothetical protein